MTRLSTGDACRKKSQPKHSEWRCVRADLVDDNIAAVNIESGQLLHQPLCLVQAEELWYAHADKGGQLGVLELRIDLLHSGLQQVRLQRNSSE